MANITRKVMPQTVAAQILEKAAQAAEQATGRKGVRGQVFEGLVREIARDLGWFVSSVPTPGTSGSQVAWTEWLIKATVRE